MSGFGKSSVKGRSRLPRPAAKTNACVIAVIQKILRFFLPTLKLRRGRRLHSSGKAVAGYPLSQIKRACTEVDDAVMAPQRLRPEQSGDRCRAVAGFQQSIMNEAFQVNDANFFAENIH